MLGNVPKLGLGIVRFPPHEKEVIPDGNAGHDSIALQDSIVAIFKIGGRAAIDKRL